MESFKKDWMGGGSTKKRVKANSEKIYNIGKGPKYDLIAKWVGKDKRILDVGCGAGEFSERLLKSGNRVIGVELSGENCRIAQKKIEVYLGDFLEIDIKENFDIVLFGDVLEHMYHPDKAIRKARGLANEMILCVPNFDFWGVKLLQLFGTQKMKYGILDDDHVFFFNKFIIEKMIKENWFEIIDFGSPAPKKVPGIYNRIIRWNSAILGYQFIYKCRTSRSYHDE